MLAKHHHTYDQADRRMTMALPAGEVVAYGYEDDPNDYDGRVRGIYADDANYPFPTVYYTYTGPAVTQRLETGENGGETGDSHQVRVVRE